MGSIISPCHAGSTLITKTMNPGSTRQDSVFIKDKSGFSRTRAKRVDLNFEKIEEAYCFWPLCASCIPPCIMQTSVHHAYFHASCIPPCIMHTSVHHAYLRASCIPPCILYASVHHAYLHASCIPPCIMRTSMHPVYLRASCIPLCSMHTMLAHYNSYMVS